MAETEFRFGIVSSLALIIFIFTFQSGHALWLLLLWVFLALLAFGQRHLTQAVATLVQAIVLKMLEPPVLERLREALAKKREEEEANRPAAAAKGMTLPLDGG